MGVGGILLSNLMVGGNVEVLRIILRVTRN